MADALLPCPFCGCATMLHGPDHNRDSYHVWCAGLEGSLSDEAGCCAQTRYCETEAEAIAAWNRRAPAAPSEAARNLTDLAGKVVGRLIARGFIRAEASASGDVQRQVIGEAAAALKAHLPPGVFSEAPSDAALRMYAEAVDDKFQTVYWPANANARDQRVTFIMAVLRAAQREE